MIGPNYQGQVTASLPPSGRLSRVFEDLFNSFQEGNASYESQSQRNSVVITPALPTMMAWR
jgi:hypothetical protein